MQPRISFSVDSLLGRKTTRGDGDGGGDVSKMTMLTELDRNDNQVSTRELPAAAASVPPLLLAAVRSHHTNHGGAGDRRRQNSWRGDDEEEEEGAAETRFPLSEVLFRQPEARGERIPTTPLLNDSVDCIKEEEEEEESEGELCVDGDEEEGDEEGGGGGIYEDEDEDPDDCSPRQSPGRLHPVMPTPLMGRPHPLSGLPAGLLRPPPWGHPPPGHLALPFGSSLFDKGILLILFIIIVSLHEALL